MADTALAAMLAAQNPDLVAREAAMNGFIPPGLASAGSGLSKFLDPISGISKATVPEQPSLASGPQAPGIPQSRPIPQESLLLELLLKGMAPQAQPDMNLSQLLGR